MARSSKHCVSVAESSIHPGTARFAAMVPFNQHLESSQAVRRRTKTATRKICPKVPGSGDGGRQRRGFTPELGAGLHHGLELPIGSRCSAVLEKDNVDEMYRARTTKSLLGQHRIITVQRYITEGFPELHKYQREFDINHGRI